MEARALGTPTNEVVAPRWLEQRLDASWLRVIDVRVSVPEDRKSGIRLAASCTVEPRQELAPFERGHVPGSVLLDVAATLFDDYGAPVWAPEVARTLSQLGVGDAHTIVIVDDAVPEMSLVLAAILRRAGHDKTFLLAGGFPRWCQERRPISQTLATHPPASFTARMSG